MDTKIFSCYCPRKQGHQPLGWVNSLAPVLVGISLNGALGATAPVSAQVSADQTLPTNSMVKTDGDRVSITQGTQVGPNLFHSFQEFSVPFNGTASFADVGVDIEHVISRVTGASTSTIEGVLEVIQSNGTLSPADFFLINPNGIIFGPDARLRVGGSFIATTAASMDFADGTIFRANGTQSSPLLTVSVPAGLQLNPPTSSNSQTGTIVNQSFVPLLDENGDPVPDPDFPDFPLSIGLQVPTGHTLALVGHEIVQDNSVIAVEGGRIELAGVSSGQVGFASVDTGWTLDYDTVEEFGPLTLATAILDASGDPAGEIQLQGDTIEVLADTFILADTNNQDGGAIALNAETIEIDASSIETLTAGDGRGGDLRINGSSIHFNNESSVTLSAEANGDGGDLNITGSNIILEGFSFLSAVTNASGNSGSIEFEGERLSVRDGSQVLAEVSGGTGNAGRIVISMEESITLSGGQIFQASRGFPAFWSGSAILTGVFDDEFGMPGQGTGGQVVINTDQLNIEGGAFINVSTFSSGDAGLVDITASEITLDGTALNPDGTLFLSSRGLPQRSAIASSAQPNSEGDGNTITISTEHLNIRNGAFIQAGTFGPGDGGDVMIRASDSIEIEGTDRNNLTFSYISAASAGAPGVGFVDIPEATGSAGNIDIQTPELRLKDQGAIVVGSFNPNVVDDLPDDLTDESLSTSGSSRMASFLGRGDRQGRNGTGDDAAGTITIDAKLIALDNRGQILAETAAGTGGNILLENVDTLIMTDNSLISTTAGLANRGGTGGNITIDADFIVSALDADSDIRANAFEGSGGNIVINSRGITGIRQQDAPTDYSDITASSERGVSGTIQINTVDDQLDQEEIPLPDSLIDPTRLITQGCEAPNSRLAQTQGQFTQIGRGGITPSSADLANQQDILADIQLPLAWRLPLHANAISEFASEPVVEAQGWQHTANGDVILVSVPSEMSTQRWCQARP